MTTPRCTWPGCNAPPKGRWCTRDHYRISALGEPKPVTAEQIAALPARWEERRLAQLPQKLEAASKSGEARRRRASEKAAAIVEAPQAAVQSTAAAEQGSEPDRSGWPVLVKVGEGSYAWESGRDPVYCATSRAWWAFADVRPCPESPDYPTARAAADAIHARLPDEVSELPAGAREVAAAALSAFAENAAQPVERWAQDFAAMPVPAELVPQPAPTNTEGDVWQEVINSMPADTPVFIIELMRARREQGFEKYKRYLGRKNGRSHRADAIQEACDGIVYARCDHEARAERCFLDALCELTGAPSHLGRLERELHEDRALIDRYREALAKVGSDYSPAGIATLWAESEHRRRQAEEAEALVAKRDAEIAELRERLTVAVRDCDQADNEATEAKARASALVDQLADVNLALGLPALSQDATQRNAALQALLASNYTGDPAPVRLTLSCAGKTINLELHHDR